MIGRRGLIGVVFALGLTLVFGWSAPAMAAYSHMGEQDSGVFRLAHPAAAGSKLDSCTLCHTGGTATSGGKTTNYGSCQWCHVTYGYDASGEISATLNPYGAAYLAAGRSVGAVSAIDGLDSDGDNYANAVEIAALRYPGDATDDPSKIPASYRVYTRAQLMAMLAKTQFLAMNASKSDDSYSTYTGVTVEELLTRAGMLSSATGIKVYAPDGFSVYHPIDPPTSTVAGIYPVKWTYPQGTFWYDAVADLALNPTTGWVNYSAPGCAGRASGSLIDVTGGLKLLLAYARDSREMTPGVLTATNKLDGEGPYRLVPPQVVPGPLDQRSTNSTTTVIWPYNNSWDHNAGYSSRSATIIKVEPLPVGTTDINVFEAGWDLLDESKIVVYGALEPMDSSVTIKSSTRFARLARPFVLSGALSPANVGDRCLVEVRKPRTARWSYSSARGITSVSGGGSGAWWYRYTPRVRGAYAFRVRFLGDITREPCLSRTITVTAK